MTELSPDATKKMIKDAVTEALETSCVVKCPISPEAAGEVGHFFGMVRDVGEGDMGCGVETIRKHMDFIASLRQSRDKIGDWVSKTIVVTIIAGILTLLYHVIKEGIKVALGK